MRRTVEPIPEFDAHGNLPPGVYLTSLADIEERFAWNSRRRKLFLGLKAALKNLARSGVKQVWINGSFVTSKEFPNDIDGCWEYEPSMNVDRLEPVFLDMEPPREAMRKKYGVDFLIAGVKLSDPKAGSKTVQEFFQVARNGNPTSRRIEIRKGILRVTLGDSYDSE